MKMVDIHSLRRTTLECWCLKILIFNLLFCSPIISSIRIVRYYDAERPEWIPHKVEYIEALINTKVTLKCKVILELQDELYSLKWYRKYNGTFHEFYSFISSPNQTIHHNSLPGIKLDLNHIYDNGETIHLLNVDLDTDGMYRCEVISDESFQADRKDINLTVLVPPMEVPRMTFKRRIFELGEEVQLKCVSGFSRPFPQIKWYINGISMQGNTSIMDVDDEDDDEINETTPMMMVQNDFDNQTINHFEEKTNNPKLDRLLPSPESSILIHEELEEIKKKKKVISVLNFILKEEHIIQGTNYFSVRCVSSVETKFFYPQKQELSSEVDFKLWPNYPTTLFPTPIIVGLQNKYEIGDIVQVECLIPNVLESTNIKAEWSINNQRISSRMSKMLKHRSGRYCKLRFQLNKSHLDKYGSFSLKCTSFQKWPRDFYNKNKSIPADDNFGIRPMQIFKSFGATLIPIGVVIAVFLIG